MEIKYEELVELIKAQVRIEAVKDYIKTVGYMDRNAIYAILGIDREEVEGTDV